MFDKTYAVFYKLDKIVNPIAEDIAQVMDDPMDVELGEIYKTHLMNLIMSYERVKKEVYNG